MSKVESKWGKDYILLIHSSIDDVPVKREEYEEVIKTSALMYQKLKKIPPARMFVSDIEGARINYETFTVLLQDYMSGITENDKLFIFAHGSSTNLGKLEPKYVAGLLKYGGVKRVGLITFKSCDVGKGTFLVDFVEALKKVKIYIGYAKGYTDGSQTVDLPAGPVVIEKIWKEDFKPVQGRERVWQDNYTEIQGHARYRVVKGHFNYKELDPSTKKIFESFAQMRRVSKGS